MSINAQQESPFIYFWIKKKKYWYRKSNARMFSCYSEQARSYLSLWIFPRKISLEGRKALCVWHRTSRLVSRPASWALPFPPFEQCALWSITVCASFSGNLLGVCSGDAVRLTARLFRCREHSSATQILQAKGRNDTGCCSIRQVMSELTIAGMSVWRFNIQSISAGTTGFYDQLTKRQSH